MLMNNSYYYFFGKIFLSVLSDIYNDDDDDDYNEQTASNDDHIKYITTFRVNAVRLRAAAFIHCVCVCVCVSVGYDMNNSNSRRFSSCYEFDRRDESPLQRLRQQYWTTKQTVRTKLGKREDEHLIASDAQLDAKIQVYDSVKQTCERLLQCIERYQDCLCAQTENALGRFLKHEGKADHTQAGKMMASVGRAQSYTAQQRLALRIPLARLFADLEVFTERAVADCHRTVEETETTRQRYRGSLMWMNDVSQQLDPDTFKQLEQFRKVQAQVKLNKQRLDACKLNSMQKIDLLVASRCNLFSKLLVNYRNSFLRFWDKTCNAHCTIADSLKGYQHYEFTILKDLMEPCQKVAEVINNDHHQQQTTDNNHLTNHGKILYSNNNNNNLELEIFDEKLNLNKKTQCDQNSTKSSSSTVDLLKTFLLLPNSCKKEFDGDSITFTDQWLRTFGSGEDQTAAKDDDLLISSSQFSNMPSDLLDLHLTQNLNPAAASGNDGKQQAELKKTSDADASVGKKNPTRWLDLFADLDPIQSSKAAAQSSRYTEEGDC
ncbi:Islet cell autoantigen 1 [Trichinella nelsoni]|uniref:Islet cell autoantigen 1 n=1 Tax=Trichinella nelsoni TaxID=6336 RepID=A0A0V0SI37_9BILA|nr:Islet cell autoantigen 1 [Trichinella nelsoni]